MSMWTAIALISIASIILSRDKGKHQNSKKIAAELKIVQDRLDAMESDLRHRIETLERIVTNPKEDLKRQFDYLDKAS